VRPSLGDNVYQFGSTQPGGRAPRNSAASQATIWGRHGVADLWDSLGFSIGRCAARTRPARPSPYIWSCTLSRASWLSSSASTSKARILDSRSPSGFPWGLVAGIWLTLARRHAPKLASAV